jgi:type IX secretion system PorP/SprF family membrane protein
MKIKITILFSAFWVLALTLSAQQYPDMSNFSQNILLFNPAATGLESFIDARGGYRKKWAQLEGSPTTSFFSAHGGTDVVEKDTAGAETVTGRSGFGGYFLNDRFGVLSRNQVNLAYSYHLPLTTTTKISFGATFGLGSFRLGELNPRDKTDALLQDAGVSKLTPDLGLGAIVYSSKYFIGVSAQQVLQSKLSFTDAADVNETKLNTHVFLTGGYNHQVNENVRLQPSFMLRSVKGPDASYDINLKMIFKETFWGGVSLRNQDALVLMVGARLESGINFGYAFDLVTADISKAAANGHEIHLGYNIFRKGAEKTKPKFW